MKNGDYIRNMDDDRLASFLFIWGINTVTSFLEAGGTEVMNAKDLREWMKSDNFKCRQTYVSEDSTVNDDFTRKEGSQDGNA